MWALVAVGLAIIYLVPRLTTAVPAPLVAIVALTAFVVIAGVGVPDVGDEGALPDALPVLGIPSVPLNLETLQIIAPYALTLSVVGLLESLMTAKLVDDITETPSDKDRESRGQGIATTPATRPACASTSRARTCGTLRRWRPSTRSRPTTPATAPACRSPA